MAIRVLTVDDSPLFLQVLAAIIAGAPELELAGAARDGREAVARTLSLAPDVVTLDVEMPVMDGLEALERIMEARPTRVIMLSSHTRSAAAATIRALELGACDVVEKPTRPLRESGRQLAEELVGKITAVGSRPWRAARRRAAVPAGIPPGRRARVVVIGASTGGTNLLAGILTGLPARMDATVVVVQHLPGRYTEEFTRLLAGKVACPVRAARDGDLVEAGTVFVAPGGEHLSIYGNSFRVRRGEPVNGHQPSIDVAMIAAARRFCPDVCGVLLTGIGRDGAQGIVEIRNGGGLTIAQDEETSVVFGMPKAAIESGKVDHVLPDSAIRSELAALVAR
jgi:two-component system, chemotaxis family, protein-glutamate methylesterase/glutaminase